MRTKTTTLAGFLALVWLIPASRNSFAQSRDLGQGILINIGGAPSLSRKNTTVTMVEFSDYQCPLSSQYFNWTMKQVVEKYVKTGQMTYAFRDFPLESIHPLALKAAEGARCAGEQGKYWEMHDRLLRNQMAIEVKVLPLHAGVLGLDIARFQQCLDSGKYTAKVRESAAEGKQARVEGTPWFFLGLTGPDESKLKAVTVINGSQPYAAFKEAIDKLLSLQTEQETEH